MKSRKNRSKKLGEEQASYRQEILKLIEESKGTPIELLAQERESWFEFAGGSRKYAEDNVALREQLNEPRYSSGRIREVFPSVTYRQINHWEKKNLITPRRQTEERGWRKFSLVDVFCLAIITELRRYGASLSSIRRELLALNSEPGLLQRWLGDNMFETAFGLETSKFVDSLTEVEMHTSLSTAFHVGVVYMPGERLLLAPTDVLLVFLASLMQQAKSFLYIPASEYIRLAGAADGRRHKVEDSGLAGILTSGYRNLLWLLQGEGTESIQITKKSGGTLAVRCLRRRAGRFDDNDILDALQSGDHLKTEIVKKDGKVVTITIEDRLQIQK